MRPHTWLLVPPLTLGLAFAARAAEPPHTHEHAQRAGLTLHDGKKWQTDKHLREGMAHIRDQVQAALPAVHEQRYTPAQYGALAAGIEQEITAIMSTCTLPPDADANLHVILVQLWSGTAAMKSAGDRAGGVVKVAEGLESYARSFDHPGWKPLEH